MVLVSDISAIKVETPRVCESPAPILSLLNVQQKINKHKEKRNKQRTLVSISFLFDFHSFSFATYSFLFSIHSCLFFLPRHYRITNRNTSTRTRNKTTNLWHQNNNSTLSNKSWFSTHIWTGDNYETWFFFFEGNRERKKGKNNRNGIAMNRFIVSFIFLRHKERAKGWRA